MTRRVRIPLLADILIVDTSAGIRRFADDRRLDRPRVSKGPLINRLMARRMRRVLRTPNGPLTSARSVSDATRSEESAAVASLVNGDPSAVLATLAEPLDEAAAFVAGHDTRDVGYAAQELFGRPFVDTFKATEETLEAADRLQAALTRFDPLALGIDAIFGRVRRAQKVLAEAMGHSAAGVHAVGIAVHNLIDGLEAMRQLAAQSDPAHIPRAAAMAEGLIAPRQVMRQSATVRETLEGTLRRGTLVLLSTRKADDRGIDARIAFLSDGWSACPASAYVTALLGEVWDRARVLGPPQAAATEGRSEPATVAADAPEHAAPSSPADGSGEDGASAADPADEEAAYKGERGEDEGERGENADVPTRKPTGD